MAKLTTKQRKAMPSSMFAGGKKPGTKGSYPIPDASHARDALARVSNKSPALKKKVRAAVKKRFPGIKQSNRKQYGLQVNITKPYK